MNTKIRTQNRIESLHPPRLTCEDDYEFSDEGITWPNIKHEPDDPADTKNIINVGDDSHSKVGCDSELDTLVTNEFDGSRKTVGYVDDDKKCNVTNVTLKKEKFDNLEDVKIDIEYKQTYKWLEIRKTEECITSFDNLSGDVTCSNQASEQVTNKPDDHQDRVGCKSNDEKRNVKWYHCRFCEYKTRHRTTLKLHFTVKHDENAEWFSCQCCEYKTRNMNHLEQHFKYKHASSVKWYSCQFCDFKTKANTSLRRHFTLKHSQNPEWHHCQHCAFRTKYKESLEAHLQCKHDVVSKKSILIQCQFCNFKSTKSCLKRHLIGKHDNNAEWHHCPHCVYKTKLKDVLKTHMIRKHDGNAKYYQCQFCDFETKNKHSLTRHFTTIHDDNAELYSCRLCDFRTKNKYTLMLHFKYRHDDNAERYRCQFCESTFKSKCSLRQHFRRKHKQNVK